jgi:predicted enzyme related to lactoylglutathione lyase
MFYNPDTFHPVYTQQGEKMTKRNIVHIELPTQNAKTSSEFYEKLFGWKITRDEQMDYTMWEPQEGPGGGFNPLGDNTKVGEVLIYVDSEDIEADLKKIEALGGITIRPKTEIPSIGWFGMFKDPTGNIVGLYTDMHPA